MASLSRRDFLKISAYTTSGILAADLLAACAQAAPTVGPIHLVLGSYIFGNVADQYKKLVDAYTAKNPNLTIDFEFADYSGFMDKLTTEIAAGTNPDIAMLIPDALPKYFAQGLLLDLEEMVQGAGIDFSQWYPAGWEGLSFGPDQHHYAVPLTFDADVLWYNKDLFDKAGAKYPDETWTYDTLVEAAKALTIRSGDTVTQWGLGIGWEPWYQYMAMFGVKPWDGQNFQKSMFDTPGVIDAVQKAADFYVKHGTTPVQPPNSGLAVNGADVQFMAGNMAMMQGGTWMTQTYLDPTSGIKDFAFDNAYSPTNPATGERMTIGQPNVFIVFKNSKNPKEAQALVQNMALSKEGQEQLAASVEIPAYKPAAQTTYKANWLDKLGHPDVQLDTMDKYSQNVQFGLLDENTWMVQVDDQLDAVWKGADVAETCKAIAAKLDALLGEAKSKYGG
jgi:multiple sugar transport system substrate-binding protein